MHKVTATYMAQIVLTKGILMLSQTVIRGILESKKFEQIHSFIHTNTTWSTLHGTSI